MVGRIHEEGKREGVGDLKRDVERKFAEGGLVGRNKAQIWAAPATVNISKAVSAHSLLQMIKKSDVQVTCSTTMD